MRLPSFLLRNLGKKRQSDTGDGDTGDRYKDNAAADRLNSPVNGEEKTKRWSWASSLRIRRGGRPGKRGSAGRVADETWKGKGVTATSTDTENRGSTRTGVPGNGDNSTAPASASVFVSHPHEVKENLNTDQQLEGDIEAQTVGDPRNGKNHATAPALVSKVALPCFTFLSSSYKQLLLAYSS